MKYLILSIMVCSNILIMSIDTAPENRLVAELELCIQAGADVEDLKLYQESLHHLALDKIAEIQATCEEYSQAIAIADELRKNDLLAAYVELREQQRTQEKSVHLRAALSAFPEEIRKRGFKLSWRMRGSAGPHVHRVQSHIVDLSTNAEVDDYVERENSRIKAIQEWLNEAKIIAENKKRAEESGTELYEQLKDKYLQQVHTQH